MKKHILNILIFLIFTTGCSNNIKENNSANPIQKLPLKAQKLYSKGIKSYKSNDFVTSIKNFKTLSKLYPNLKIAHYNLGLAYANTQQYKLAIEAWEEGIRIEPNNENIHYNLGKAYAKIKNNKKAVEHYTKFINLKPDDAQTSIIKKEISTLHVPTIGKDFIGRITITDKVDDKNNIPIEAKTVLKPTTNEIYTTIELIDTPENSSLLAKWFYKTIDNELLPVNSIKFNTSGTKNILLSIKKPAQNWPIGEYQLKIYANNEENTSIPFYIY